MNCSDIINRIQNNEYDGVFYGLYGHGVECQKKRYTSALSAFAELYGNRECRVFSVPGRSEISGNHTDHNKGCVLAASVDVDIIAVAGLCDDEIRVKSEGFDEDICALTEPFSKEFAYSSKALIYGVTDGFKKHGYKTGGFCAYTASSVMTGSGLSSSAAYENMLGLILSQLYNGGIVKPLELAVISQYAENEFFGKPCGLMDQAACAYGGFVFIDFGSGEPHVEKIEFDPAEYGYDLCIVNTGSSHADLNEDYASVPAEMKKTAQICGESVLCGLKEEDILKNLPRIREEAGDRAALRAIHFIRECIRVKKQKNALENKDIKAFFELVKESGRSSFEYLQNVYSPSHPTLQPLALALCVTDGFLRGEGAYRVHGGGFAGTVQAYVPKEKTEEYKKITEEIFGAGSCFILKVRKYGAYTVI